jgi:hypothetical protein
MYKEHIEKLAAELGCKLDQDIRFNDPLYGMMFVEEEPPRIEIPVVKDQITYLIALHELGHVYHGHTQARPPYQHKRFYFDNGVLKSEAEAWQWALDNCADEIEDDSRRFIWDKALGSYYHGGYVLLNGKADRLWNGNRHHVEFVYDKPDDYFTSIVKRIQGSLSGFEIEYKG